MDKRWYPAAMTALLVGCGGIADTGGGNNGGAADVDAGSPHQTGGMVAYAYGVLRQTGGTSTTPPASATGGSRATVDAGAPSQTGGMPIVACWYGCVSYGVLRVVGGASSTPTNSTVGGADAAIDAGLP